MKEKKKSRHLRELQVAELPKMLQELPGLGILPSKNSTTPKSTKTTEVAMKTPVNVAQAGSQRGQLSKTTKQPHLFPTRSMKTRLIALKVILWKRMHLL